MNRDLRDVLIGLAVMAAAMTLALAASVWLAAPACAVEAAAPPPEPDPTLLDLILAWGAKAGVALLVGVLGSLGLVAAIRRVPWLQELVMPSADELHLLSAALEEKVRDGGKLTHPEAIVACGLAVRCGLTLLAALLFAGLLLLRL